MAKATATYHTPTTDELAALRSYAKEHGRKWKEDLSMDWYFARVPEARARDCPNRGSILHGMRNHPHFGPRGLAAFQFPAEEA